VEAYDLYLKGRSLWLERGYANVRASIPYFERAIERDPQFARAHAGLALSYGTLPAYVPEDPGWAAAKAAHARRAVQLDPNLPDARVALGLVYEDDTEFERAREEYRAALAVDPGEAGALHVFGGLLLLTGHTDEAIAVLRRATRIDPLAKSAGSNYALGLAFARRFADATTETQRVLALDSVFVLARMMLGFVQAFGGMPDSAVATLEHNIALNPDAHLNRALLTYAYAASGRRAAAERLRAELHTRTTPADSAHAAFADLALGDPEPLLRLLEDPASRRSWHRYVLGFGCNPMLDPLRDEPRYQAVVSEMGTVPCMLPPVWTLPRD
jgi:eukaryotic-like serine/threonine-protein kinase